MSNSLVFAFFIDIMFLHGVFTFQARVGMEVPFDLLGTVYHQVIIINSSCCLECRAHM